MDIRNWPPFPAALCGCCSWHRGPPFSHLLPNDGGAFSKAASRQLASQARGIAAGLFQAPVQEVPMAVKEAAPARFRSDQGIAQA